MKTICALLLVLLLVIPLPASAAAGNTQTVELAQQGNVLTLSAQNSPAFWEYPTLSAGESYTAKGVLTLVNNTQITRTLSLDHVALPYDNPESLRYLNHLILCVTEGDTVLYKGPYSRVNNSNGLSLHRELAAGQSTVLSVSLHCDYTYEGAGLGDNELLDWQFYTFTEKAATVPERFNDPALLEIAIAVGAVGFLLIGIFVFDHLRKRQG